MTLGEKLGFVNLANAGGYENRNTAVPRLCIPALTLQDSPNGIANGAIQVTQLPASLGIAATFDTGLSYRYGQVLGQEARGKGIDVLQGPELNLDRVPESGRAFEAYGEDPYLTAALGVANVKGVQSEGIMADAKHYSAYNQETARFVVNQVISQRALAEIYQVPFQAAVEQGHVASVMCSYGSLNGVNSCSSPYLYQALKAWGFPGFVRSDLDAVEAPLPAFAAGMAMIKPAVVRELRNAVLRHDLGVSHLDDAVRRVLTEMFAFGLVAHPLTGNITVDVATPAHESFALQAAERSIVLLKDTRSTLPLDNNTVGSVAVIGTDAGQETMSAGYGSSRVKAASVVTPFVALKAALGPRATVSYTPGGGASLLLPSPSRTEVVAARPLKPGPEPPEFTGADPQGIADLEVLKAPSVTRDVATAPSPGRGRHWTTWEATLTPRRTGLYTLSLTQSGDTWLYVGNRLVMASPGLHAPGPWSETLRLVGGRHYPVRLTWFVAVPEVEPQLGLAYDSAAIAAAVSAARKSRVAVVFVNDFNSEGFDRLGLSLPGDQDELISAVAAANPRTVVVLNTGGPVLMPWLSNVAAVVEAWYPGQEGGNAVAAVLTGAVDPSGHLPVTFPASSSQGPISTPEQWPGVNSTVRYSEGLEVGYRYYNANHLRPLFPFGFGLSYTRFSLASPSVGRQKAGIVVKVRVRNTGRRAGTAVVQVYLSYPPGSGEPPDQLRAFTTAELSPGQSRVVSMRLPSNDFTVYAEGHFATPSGNFMLRLGQSSQALGPSLRIRP